MIAFGIQDLAGLLRSQLHGRMFDLWMVRIVSVEREREPGTLNLHVEAYDPQDPNEPAQTLHFQIRIESK